MRPESTVTVGLQLLLSKADSMPDIKLQLESTLTTDLTSTEFDPLDGFQAPMPILEECQKVWVRDACIVHKAFTKWGVLKAHTGTLVNASEYQHCIDHILWSNASKIH